MSFRQWVEPPRRLLGLFLAVMVTMTAALGWLSWLLLEQDRDLSRQRIHERLEGAADLASAVLVRKLLELEASLAVAPPVESGHQDLVSVVFGPEGVEAYPAANLAYYPFVSPLRSPDTSLFGSGEALEFQQHNYVKAAAVFRDLARARDPAVRAEALLRLARNLRKSGAASDALAVYGELGRFGGVPVEGLPADLAARYGRLILLAELKQLVVCEREGHALYDDLLRGRWRLGRGPWFFYAAEVRRCFHPDSDAEAYEQDASALASGVEWLWQEWKRLRSGEGRATGRSGLWINDRPILVLWRGTAGRFAATVAGRGFLEKKWGAALRAIEERHLVRFMMSDAEGHRVLGNSQHATFQQQITRSLADLQLPWTLRTVNENPGADLKRLAERRHLLLAGLGLTGLVVLAGGYFIARALARELEVARLQTDFVAAVSHEFRTPLASLRQVSELLADGRVANEQRRQAYYEALRTESERLHRLVENLLDFRRMEAGAQEYRFEPVDPGT
ncbi:MAG: hypothetical protein HY646_12065, partial [Acidobacteria bacterium]|nr:hypothetical protein [Acidobacteriota bacterium]